MVAIFTGLGTGFERGSGSVLGSQGLLGSANMGRGNEQVFLNAATGNLMISQQDEFLVGLGPDAAINRTYNSQGDLSDDNGDNWRFDAERKVFALTGTVNTAGSTVQRMSSDGSAITYAWDSTQSAYVAKDGSGAYDKLTYNSGASTWTWTDGDSQITETYGGFGSNNWVLSSQTNADGLSVTFDHVNGTSHVNRVTTADGSWVQYDWSGNNVSDIVTGYTDLATNTSKTLTRTRYSYDASNRLQTVTVDLSPNDNSIADGKTYTTTYNYVGTTKLIASIVQSDGSQVSIGYDQTATPATSKVTSITETVSTGVTRTSTIAYSAGYTTITDALGQQVRLDYDASDNLTMITMPPASAGAAQQVTQFAYDSSGNVASVTHGTLVAGPTELVTNGTFDSSAGWTTTGNTTFAGGTANVNSPSSNFELYQLLSMPSPGTQFDVTFTVSNYVSGAIAYIAWGGGGQVLGQARTGNGTYTERFTVPPGGGVTIPYSGMVSFGNGFVGTIDNLSVRAVAVGPQDQTSYTYDANGNVASITDPLGNVTTRTYSSRNQLLTETTTASDEGSGSAAHTIHYVYDSPTDGDGLDDTYLRFRVSAEGDVTEYRYNSSGLVTSTIQYSGAQYTGSTFDEATLNNWVGGLNPTVQVQRTDTAYDARGEVATVTSYAELYRNRLTNPAFAGTTGWAVDYNPNNIVVNGTAYSGIWAGTSLIKMDLNATAAGQVASIGTDDSHSVDVYPGETLFAQVGAETLGSATTAQLVVHFWDANGNYITGTTVQTLSGNNLSYNTKLSGYVAVPTGAAKARLEVYAYTNGAGAGSLALTSPILESATSFADSGGNLVQDSRFEDGTSGWSTWGQGSNVVQGGLTVGTDASTAKRYAQVTFNSGSTSDLVNIAYAGLWPIEGGERVAVRAGIGATSGVGPTHLDVQFLDANGTVVSEQVVGTLSGGQPFNTQIAGFAQAPTNAVSMRLLANFWASATNSNQTVTLTEPYVAKATAQQSAVPAFTPGVPLQALALDGAQSATYSRTGFVYDQSGKLLSSQVDGKNAQTYVYDGLGRVTSAVDLNVGTTTYAFNDTNTTTTVTLASGLVETSTYNKLGQLLSYSKTTEPNYIANDLLLDGTDGWRPNNVQVVAGPNDSLPFVFQQTSSTTDGYADNAGTGGMRPLPPGTTFNLSYQAKPGASGQQFQSGIYWFDSAGNYISGSVFDNFPSDTNNFTTIQNQVTRPSNAASYYVYVLAVHGSVGQFGGLKLTTPTTAASSVSQTDIYKYDLDGRLRVSTDATGRNSYYIYDHAGRKVADVLNSGHMVEYKYDAENRIIATVDYGGSNLTSAQLATLDNPNAAVDIASFRPASSSSDLWSWTVYDKDGHVLQSIDGAGDTCVNAYDGNGRLVSTTHYFNKIGAATLAGFQTTPPSVVTLPATDGRDVVSRNFYDKDGLLVGQLDGEGYLRELKYDGAGQKIEDRSYAIPTSAALRATGSLNALRPAQSATDRVTFYTYDGEGQLRFVTDANGNVTQTDYDQAGHATGVTRYAVPIASTGNHSLDNVKALLLASGAPSNTQNRQSWTVYDSGGRAAYTIDGEGAVTSFAYNGSGQVIKAVQFAAARPTSSLPDKLTLDSWAASNAGNPANRTTRNYYDGAGELRYTVDAENYVTRRTEDAEGRLVSIERFANAIATDDTTTIAALQGNVASSGGIAAVMSYTYDRIGRLLTVTDPEGSVTEYDHGWGASNLTTLMHVAAGTGDESLTSYVYDNAGRVIEEHRAYGTADEAVTKYSYDGLGNRLTITDPDNHVTSFFYDKIGNVTQKVDALNGSTTYTHDAFGNIIQETDPLGRSTYNYYDALDRLIRSRDAEDYVTATGYDAFGDVTSVTRYFNRTTATPSTGVWPDVTADSRDATTSFQYDRLGRVVVSTDAQGGYEQYVLNAFGDRTTVRNKLGGTITNTYDRRGLLLSETLPMASINSAGTPVASTVTNRFTYDGRRNRTQMIEAFGLGEQRTTTYAYDKADRLISKSGDAVTTVGYNDFTSTTTVSATSSSVVPTESYVYDRRGNLIQVTDANGARTFSYYDKVDRKIAEVNALGTLTSSTYDAAGNKLTDRVYGDFLASLPSVPGGSPPNPINSSNYRQTSYAYDLLNRLTTTSIAGALVGSWNGTSGVTTATLTVSSILTYDANGNVVKSTDANGNAVFTYYDSLGRKTVQVDALNYVTKWTYDAEGNVLSETRFATALGAAPVVGTVPAMPASTAADRVTNFTYDRNGHRLTETRTGVTAWTVSSSNGALSAASTNSLITYTYNALGQVLTKVEATGDKVAYAYDQTGRLTKETRTIDGQSYAYADQTGANVTPEVIYSYNGLNNLTRTQQGNQATIEASATAGRITTYAYGAGGRLAAMTDAAGGTHSYDYDAAGNQVRDSYARLLKRFSDGSTQSASEAVLYRRDLLGRVVTQTIADLLSGTRGDSQNSEFDAYGEVSRRGINGLWQESFTYNNRGLVEKTNSGDGVWRFFAYDANGNQTLAIESAGNDLSSKTLSQLLTTDFGGNPVGSAYVSGLNATISLYDKRNQATQVLMPQRELAAGASRVSLNIGQTYNAFGEVATQTDARGNTTTLAYNTMGRVIQKVMPQASYTSESGAVATASPVETYYYDLSGRAIGKQDANGNIITQNLLAGTGYGTATALTTAEFHPDGGVAKTFYDVFGDARVLRDELNQDETHSYDGMGRLMTLVHRGGLLTDNYTYDLLGQRLTHTDNVHATRESTGYDLQGRVSSTINFAGDQTAISYSWDSTIGTALGTTGGWAKTTSNWAGTAYQRSDVEKTDVHGLTVSDFDLGNHTTNYIYDLAGRMTGKSSGGTSETYSYFNTGNVSQIVDAAGSGLNTITATFQYDANGNRTYEGYSGTVYSFYLPSGTTSANATLQNATITYDALGRISSFTDRDSAGNVRITISKAYDLNGNVRHVLSTYPDLVTPQNGNWTTDQWYRYDGMNRMVVADGRLSGTAGAAGTTIVRGAGEDVTYDVAGRRATQTRDASLAGYSTQWVWYPEYDPANGHYETFIEPGVNGDYQQVAVSYQGSRRETYTYTADGALTTTSFEETGYSDNGDGTVSDNGVYGPMTLRARDDRDALGRVIEHREYDASGTVNQDHYAIVYDLRNNVTSDSLSERKLESGAWHTYLTNTTNVYDGSGALSYTYNTAYRDGSDSAVPDSQTNYNYAWYGAAEVASSTYDSDRNSSSNPVYTSTYNYDGLGRAAYVSIADGRPRTVSFAYNSDGQILKREERSAATANPLDYHYFVNGLQIGDLTNNGNNDPNEIDYAQSEYVEQNWGNGTGPFLYGTSSGVTDGDMGGGGYDFINPANRGSALTGSSYTVQAGDTLQGIAGQVWGDASLWYMIASANGLSADSPLVSGQSLNIPDRVTSIHNNAGTFRPYDPADAAGNLSPTTPATPKPPKHNKCGAFGQLFVAAIAVAVAIALPEIVPALGPSMLGGGILGGAVSGAIGATAGSVLSQGVGLAAGIQDQFSFKQVALAAISGGVGGGLSGALGDAAKAAATLKPGQTLTSLQNLGVALGGRGFVAGAARAVIGSTLSQGLEIATGLQNKFDWAGVAAAGIGGGVAGALGVTPVGRGNNSIGAYLSNAGASMANDLANAATRSVFQGSDFGDNIIAGLPDVLGQTIGGMVADGVAGLRNGAAGTSGTAAAGSDQIVVTADRVHTPNPITDGFDFSDIDAEWADLEHQGNLLLLEAAGGDVSAARQMLKESFAPTYDQVRASATPAAGANAAHYDYTASTGSPGSYDDVMPVSDRPDFLQPGGGLTIGNVRDVGGGKADWVVNVERTAAMNAALAQFDHDAVSGILMGPKYGAELATGDLAIGLIAKGINLWRAGRVVEAAGAIGGRVPNAGGVIRQFTQESDQVYYRVFGDNPVGSFLTAVPPRSSAYAREALALPPTNQATFIQEVLVPAGTPLLRSRALSAFGGRGGAEQFELLTHIPTPNFGPGVPLP